MSLTSYRAAPPRAGMGVVWGGGSGGDLLFRALRRSTIGAEGFHGRVRDGIGWFAPRYGHQAVQSSRPRAPGPELPAQSSRPRAPGAWASQKPAGRVGGL